MESLLARGPADPSACSEGEHLGCSCARLFTGSAGGADMRVT